MTPAQLTNGAADDVADFLDEGENFNRATLCELDLRAALINALRRIAVLERKADKTPPWRKRRS